MQWTEVWTHLGWPAITVVSVLLVMGVASLAVARWPAVASTSAVAVALAMAAGVVQRTSNFSPSSAARSRRVSGQPAISNGRVGLASFNASARQRSGPIPAGSPAVSRSGSTPGFTGASRHRLRRAGDAATVPLLRRPCRHGVARWPHGDALRCWCPACDD